MNLEEGLLYGLLEDKGNVERILLLSTSGSDFHGSENRQAFNFIIDHFEKHKSLPSVEVVEELCEVKLEPQGVDFGFLVSEFLQRKLFKKIKSTFGEVEGLLRSNNPTEAFERIRDFVSTGSEGTTFVKPTPLSDLAPQVEEAYRLVKEGYFGLDLCWSKLTFLTMGLWPATATYFVARPGVGKTQVAVLTAFKNIEQGKRVLIVSPEMQKSEIAERFYIISSKVSASNMMRGALTTYEYDRFKTSLKEDTFENIWIIDSSDDLTLGGVESAITMTKPDLVIVDSIYMLQVKGAKGERTEKAVDWIRRASKKFHVPFLCFHQMNRTTVKDKKFGGGYDASNIALSDQLLWDAHAVFMLEQDEDMKLDKKLRIHVGKLRRGSWDGKPIDVHWDFDSMNFEEIKDGENSFENSSSLDDPFGESHNFNTGSNNWTKDLPQWK